MLSPLQIFHHCFAPPHTICFTTWYSRVLYLPASNRQEQNTPLRPHYRTRSASKFLGKVHKLAAAQFLTGVRPCTCQPSPRLSVRQEPTQHALQTRALPTQPAPPPRPCSGAQREPKCPSLSNLMPVHFKSA